MGICLGHPAYALQRHRAVALYGEPSYPDNARQLRHVSDKAIKGGVVVLPAFGTFDTLNPYAMKGVSLTLASDQRMWGIDVLNETLMVGGNEYLFSPDEPQSAYCLICKFIEFDEQYRQVTFVLNPNARFHDDTPITAEDVKVSFQLLTGDGAHPRFADVYRDVERIEVDGVHRITFYLKEGIGKQMLFRLGELPVMSAKFWENRTFGEALNDPPLLSGPYKLCRFRFGHTIDLCRVDNFWSKDHFFYKHQFNFDRVQYEFFRDRTVAFEAFKSGKLTAWVEYIAKNWATAYDFPAIQNGDIVKQQIPHKIPASYQFFVLNLRRAPFDQLAFRKVLTLAFDFEWTNKYLFNGAYRREATYFPNTDAGSRGLPSSEEKQLLLNAGMAPDHPMFSQAFTLPQTDGSGNPRSQLKDAQQLLRNEGFSLQDGVLFDKHKKPIHLEFIVDHPSMTRVIQPYIRNLRRLGIECTLRSIDESQYKSRMDKYDFDIAVTSIPQSLIPSYELRLFFDSSQAEKKASYNYGGIKNPIVDNLLKQFSGAKTLEEVYRLTSALDRVLLWNYYTIPHWYVGHHRIAYQRSMGLPTSTPPYSLGFQAWWKI